MAIRGRSPVPGVGEGKRGARGHIGYLLRQATLAVRSAHDAALEKAGLTVPQFLVINLLDAYPGISGADLARVAQLTPQTINLIVRKLEQYGLIVRREHESHGRVLRMTLTPAGLARLKRCKALSDAIERRLLALLDRPTERKVRRWLADVATTLIATRSALPRREGRELQRRGRGGIRAAVTGR